MATRIGPEGRTAALVAVFLVAAGEFIETLGYWFTATDSIPLIYTSRVRTVTDFVELFTKPLMYGVSFPQIYYRPISSLSYAIEYWIWGLNPFGYHLTNIVLHGLAATLVAVTVGAVLRRTDAGVLAGLLFGLHPLAVELVPTAARRHDILATIFMLLALWLFVRSDGFLTRESAGSLVAYALALGSKETALVFPGVLLAWVLLRPHRSDWRQRFRSAVAVTISFGAVTLAYLAVRTVVVGSVTDQIAVPSLDLTIRMSYRYLLAGVYPMDIVGQAYEIAPELLLVTVPLCAALGWLYYSGDSMTDASGVRRGFFWLSVLVLAGLPIGLVFSADVRETVAALAFGPMWRFVGILLVGASLIGIFSTVRSERWGVYEGWRVALFFSVWFVLPLFLFLLSKEYTIRSSYGSLVPLMGLFSLIIVRALEPPASKARLSAAWQRVKERLGRSDGNRLDLGRFDGGSDARTLLAVAFVGLLVAPLVIPSPAFHSYDGWEDAGYTNRLTLTGMAEALEGQVGDMNESSELNVVVTGTSGAIRETNRDFPHAKSITYIAWHTVEAWLELRVVEGNVNADVNERVVLEHPPASVSIHTTRRNGIVYVNVSYAGRRQSAMELLERDATEQLDWFSTSRPHRSSRR